MSNFLCKILGYLQILQSIHRPWKRGTFAQRRRPAVGWNVGETKAVYHIYIYIYLYSCTTSVVKNPVNNGINYLATGAGFLPSTISLSLSLCVLQLCREVQILLSDLDDVYDFHCFAVFGMSDIVILDLNAQKMFNKIMLLLDVASIFLFSFRELEWLHDGTPRDSLHWCTWSPLFILTNVRTIPETQRRLLYPKVSCLHQTSRLPKGVEIALWLGIWSLTLSKSNSSHLKMMVSNTNLLFQGVIFRCNSLVSGKLFPLCRSWHSTVQKMIRKPMRFQWTGPGF